MNEYVLVKPQQHCKVQEKWGRRKGGNIQISPLQWAILELRRSWLPVQIKIQMNFLPIFLSFLKEFLAPPVLQVFLWRIINNTCIGRGLRSHWPLRGSVCSMRRKIDFFFLFFLFRSKKSCCFEVVNTGSETQKALPPARLLSHSAVPLTNLKAGLDIMINYLHLLVLVCAQHLEAL